jgi:Carboxypeptidase regulatory-like domain/TonB dependent receptor/TonB-dependent Receptor Plug Domain
MTRRSLRHIVTALVLLVAFVSQGTWALAGTTGGLTGSVVDATSSAPIAGAVVTVSSPSQTATVTTDASGRFGFLTLAPDTYTVSVTKDQFQPTTSPGQIVFADSVQTLTIRLNKSLTTIAHVTSTGSGQLVKSGTTADVYSVNAAQQAAASALGGGGSLNSAYSAVATVPGAYVPGNQTGYYQTVVIRGGDYDQVGYEFDGVPVNRSFDNYPSSSASSLGNSEVQVYTGATPANSQGQGLAGYINQVIRTGTYPGFADGQLGIGTPTFYHRAMAEAGGATPDRLFSYYVGIAGYNQAFNYLDNQNGASYDNQAGAPMSFATFASPCGGFLKGGAPINCVGPYAPTSNIYTGVGSTQYFMGPFNYAALSNISARDVVANFHIAIPHKNDGGRDDVQILWDSESLHNSFYSQTSDITSTANCAGATTGAACASAIGLGVPSYVDSVNYNCPGNVGKTFSGAGLAGQANCVGTYYFPNSTNRTSTGQPINGGDTIWNNQEIVKLQYTKNFGSSAFLRVYGYTYYSDWLQNGPQSLYSDFASCCSPDYELSSHTRGGSIQFQDQLNAMNLVSIQADYTTANSVRDNNSFYAVGGEDAAPIVSAANPIAGVCYTSATTGTNQKLTPTNCGSASATFDPKTGAQTGLGGYTFGQMSGAAALTGDKCGGSACEYLVAENGNHATYNQVIPKFFSTSLTDEFRPTDKWLFNLGVRLDSFTFDGSNTDYGDARDFWTNAFNIGNCVSNVAGTVAPKPGSPLSACPAGTSPAFFQNVSSQSYTYNIWQPRISGTYTVNPTNVVRFSYGRYTEAPNSAYEQYNTQQENLASYVGANFYAFGRQTPGYPISPPTSINYDLSWEHQLKGTDVSFKLTPFLRQTQDQVQNFFLDQKTGFVSGLNVGSQRSQGVEFQVQKGDFSKNGFAGTLSFAYTDSYIKYGSLASGLYGTTVITGTNQVISNYNAYTKACAPGGAWVGKLGFNHVPLCGSTNSGVAAAPCYTPTTATGGGQPVYTGCTKSDVGNPYWNSPQGQIDPGSEFPTYDIFPGGIGSSADAYGAPYVATLLLNYKHDKFAVTPSLQFEGGGKYGTPQTNAGIDPASCSGVLAGVNGYNGGGRYDATSCASQLTAIPDTYTGNFDGLGAFTQPSNLAMNMQLSYDVSPRIQLVGTLANLFNTCFGGTKAPWTSNNGNVCGYGTGGFIGEINPVGNDYNPAGHPGSVVQPFVKYPYNPLYGPFNQDGNSTKTPFQFYVTAKIKL